MKKFILFLLIAFVSLLCASTVFSQEDVTKHSSCKYCGMDRQKFAHSRFYMEFADGTTEGTCSIHCAAIDFSLNIDKAPKAMLVGDYNTKKLVNAEEAVWVIGGNKPGVMTKRAKWAFAGKEDAKQFIAENGGTLGTFEEAFKGSYEDMYADTKMIRERRMARKQKMMELKQ